MVVAGMHWPDIEPQLGDYHWDALDKLVAWTQENNLRLCMGPLVQMDKSSLPDWLFLDDGYEEVQASALKFVSEVVRGIAAKCSSGMSLPYESGRGVRLFRGAATAASRRGRR